MFHLESGSHFGKHLVHGRRHRDAYFQDVNRSTIFIEFQRPWHVPLNQKIWPIIPWLGPQTANPGVWLPAVNLQLRMEQFHSSPHREFIWLEGGGGT